MLPLHGSGATVPGAGHRFGSSGRSVASGAGSHLGRHGSASTVGSGYLDGMQQRSQAATLSRYLRRIVYYPQLDFQYAVTQLSYLLHAPSKVYKLTSWRNQTKQQWARDDPAFMVILCFFISVPTVSFALVLGKGTLSNLLGLVAANLAVFVVSGVLISTFWWWLANTYFRTRHSHSVEQQVEWMYAWDIHCNGYWPLTLSLYVVQFLLLPFLLSETFFATTAANALYALTFGYYSYVSFLGYMYLPFLNKELVTSMLYPIAAVAVLFVLFTVLNINASRYALSFFF